MDSTDNSVLVESQGSVATLTLNRPHALNAITRSMLESLSTAIESLASEPEVTVIVLTGAGRAFSAGVDLKELGDRELHGGLVGDYLDAPARKAIDLLTTVPKVAIAKINGACFTGALELALACDLIVVSEDAKLGDTHAKWGLRPTWGMSARLWRAVGITRAREISFSARTFSGMEAAQWGLAVRAAPFDQLDAEVDAMAKSIASKSPGSLAAYKQLYRRSLEVGLEGGLQVEMNTNFDIADTEERIAGFQAR